MSESDATDNGTDNVPTAIKSCFGYMSRSGDSGLNLIDQSQLEAILGGADDICSVSYWPGCFPPGGGLRSWSSLKWNWRRWQYYQTSVSHGGLELGAIWTSTSATGNDTRSLVFWAACLVTEVSSVYCLRTFGKASVAVRATLEPFLLYCFEVRLL
ncbi:hypothetical protein AMTR_s00046p00104080 [Amborella trichopoda]|uniref:Uncharacterized protein n=1 Tax=Amborella trichopoda TaxID=13333 RepID=U5DC38_AMBTC|nr:hypothetical protein AMTR_s00046p00104080 [Amborella trichopoda]